MLILHFFPTQVCLPLCRDKVDSDKSENYFFGLKISFNLFKFINFKFLMCCDSLFYSFKDGSLTGKKVYIRNS